MGKMNSHSKEKTWENSFLPEVEIYAVPKIRKRWISIVREKYGKIQTFQIYGFLKYFGEAGINTISKTWDN